MFSKKLQEKISRVETPILVFSFFQLVFRLGKAGALRGVDKFGVLFRTPEWRFTNLPHLMWGKSVSAVFIAEERFGQIVLVGNLDIPLVGMSQKDCAWLAQLFSIPVIETGIEVVVVVGDYVPYNTSGYDPDGVEGGYYPQDCFLRGEEFPEY